MLDFGLYCITDNRKDILPIVKNWIDCGVDIIQLRNKILEDQEFSNLAWKIRQLTWGTKTLFIVNDRIEVAKDVDADGVHLGQEDIKFSDFYEFHDLSGLRKYLNGQKERIGQAKIVGISSHSFEQAMYSYKLKPDYLAIGPFYFTPTHPDYQPVGDEVVKKVVDSVKNIPVVTIGGINKENLEEVLKTGIKNVAMVREVNTTNKKVIKDLRLKFIGGGI